MQRLTTWVPQALALAACLAITNHAHALIYVVGVAPAPSQCDFNSLQAAINAAQNNPGPDTIRIASDQSYTGVALTIGSQDLTVVGGYPNCAAALPPDAPATVPSPTLSGAGSPAAPVISITGAGVRQLVNLEIANGDASGIDGHGGGINFRGSG